MESTDEMQTELTSTGGNDAIVATDKQPAPSDTNIVQGTSWFGMSDQTVGIIMLVVAAMIGSVDSIMIEIAEDDGVSSNAITLYASICTLIGTILIDTYFWYVGYPDGDHVCLYIFIIQVVHHIFFLFLFRQPCMVRPRWLFACLILL